MTIVIVGLGLIGGSLAKAISARTDHLVCGIDTDSETIARALDEKAISRKATSRDLQTADVLIVALHPKASIYYLKEHWNDFNKDGVIMDCCGIKSALYEEIASLLKAEGPIFVGTHPMAGRELFGFSYSLETLFDGASLLLTDFDRLDSERATEFESLFYDIGFAQLIQTTPREHDEIIAYTSQLAHVVSVAYMMSPTAKREAGFSAGSFRDMTRVARLDEEMWSELFIFNREALIKEIDEIQSHLIDLRKAIADKDRDALKNLLRISRERKEENNRLTQQMTAGKK